MSRLGVLQSAILFIVCLVSTTVEASLIKVKFDGFSQGRTVVYQSLDGASVNAYAGMYNMSVISTTNAPDWLIGHDQIQAFCVELDQYLTTNADVTYSLVSGADFFQDLQTLDKIGRLYTGYYDAVTQQTTTRNKRIYSTAFQLALWELVYDARSPDLLDDRYQMRADKNGTVRRKANEFLTSLDSVQSRFSLFVLQSDSSQDLLVVNPIPPEVSEPSTLAILTLTLGLLMRRRFTSN